MMMVSLLQLSSGYIDMAWQSADNVWLEAKRSQSRLTAICHQRSSLPEQQRKRPDQKEAEGKTLKTCSHANLRCFIPSSSCEPVIAQFCVRTSHAPSVTITTPQAPLGTATTRAHTDRPNPNPNQPAAPQTPNLPSSLLRKSTPLLHAAARSPHAQSLHC